MKKSQTDLILKHLESGKSITPLAALKLYGSLRLGGRIYDLKKQGYPIETKMVRRNGKRFASYRLAA